MTNYSQWNSYDVSSELKNLSDKEEVEDILIPYKKMLKESSANDSLLRAEVTKFAKSMKSLANVAKLKLKSKLSGISEDSDLYKSATAAVELLVSLVADIMFIDTQFGLLVDHARNLEALQASERSRKGIQVLQYLVSYAERVQNISEFMQERYAQISTVLNMSEDLITNQLQKLWLAVDTMVANLMCELAYSSYTCGEVALSLEIGRFYLKKYSNMTNQRIEVTLSEETNKSAPAPSTADSNSAVPLTLPMQQLLRDNVIRNASSGMLVKHSMVWIIRCLGFLEIGCPYLARVHVNCIKTLHRKQPAAATDDAAAAAAAYGFAMPPQQGKDTLSSLYIYPNILAIANVVENHELQYTMHVMSLPEYFIHNSTTSVSVSDDCAPDQASLPVDADVVPTPVRIPGIESLHPHTKSIICSLCNELCSIVNRMQSSDSQLTSNGNKQTSEVRKNIQLGEFVDIKEIQRVIQYVYNFQHLSEWIKELGELVSEQSNSDGLLNSIERYIWMQLQSLFGSDQKLLLSMIMTWISRLYYEAQILYLESFYHTAQMKYYCVIIFINIWIKYSTDGQCDARSPSHLMNMHRMYHASLLNISTCLFHRNQVLYTPVMSNKKESGASSSSLAHTIEGCEFNYLPIADLLNYNALSLIDWSLKYYSKVNDSLGTLSNMKHGDDEHFHSSFMLTVKWRKVLLLEALHRYTDGLMYLQELIASWEAYTLTPALVVPADSEKVVPNEPYSSPFVGIYGDMFTQAHIACSIQDCDASTAGNNHSSTVLSELTMMPGFPVLDHDKLDKQVLVGLTNKQTRLQYLLRSHGQL